eukprot:254252-Amphidinium_carterae.1
MVEKHNDLLRRQLHLVDEQLDRDGVSMPPEAVLDESVLAKNCLLAVTGGVSPYKALYGRAPPMLMDMEPVSLTALEDDDDGIEGVSRHVHRLRELSVQAIASATASSRLDRAMRSKTRPSGMVLDVSVDDWVDFWREPTTKDVSGWRGPARVVNARTQEGMADVEWQGRTISVRLADLRRALQPLSVTSLATYHMHETGELPYFVMLAFAESLEHEVVLLGYVVKDGVWQLSRDSGKYAVVMSAAFHVASVDLRLDRAVAVRIGSGSVRVLHPLQHYEDSVLIWWPPGYGYQWSWQHVGTRSSVSLKDMLGSEWSRRVFVQFLLCADAAELPLDRELLPSVELEGFRDEAMTLRDGVDDDRRPAEKRQRSDSQVSGNLPPKAQCLPFDPSAVEEEETEADQELDDDRLWEYLAGIWDNGPPQLYEWDAEEFKESQDVNDDVSIGIEASCANCFCAVPRKLLDGELLEFTYNAEGIASGGVIIRDLNVLGPEELRRNKKEADEAKLAELRRWSRMGVMSAMLKKDAKNRVDSKWVMKWKIISGHKKIKARLTVRGFKDRQGHL